jgi:hypothetical protein
MKADPVKVQIAMEKVNKMKMIGEDVRKAAKNKRIMMENLRGKIEPSNAALEHLATSQRPVGDTETFKQQAAKALLQILPDGQKPTVLDELAKKASKNKNGSNGNGNGNGDKSNGRSINSTADAVQLKPDVAMPESFDEWVKNKYKYVNPVPSDNDAPFSILNANKPNNVNDTTNMLALRAIRSSSAGAVHDFNDNDQSSRNGINNINANGTTLLKLEPVEVPEGVRKCSQYIKQKIAHDEELQIKYGKKPAPLSSYHRAKQFALKLALPKRSSGADRSDSDDDSNYNNNNNNNNTGHASSSSSNNGRSGSNKDQNMQKKEKKMKKKKKNSEPIDDILDSIQINPDSLLNNQNNVDNDNDIIQVLNEDPSMIQGIIKVLEGNPSSQRSKSPTKGGGGTGKPRIKARHVPRSDGSPRYQGIRAVAGDMKSTVVSHVALAAAAGSRSQWDDMDEDDMFLNGNNNNNNYNNNGSYDNNNNYGSDLSVGIGIRQSQQQQQQQQGGNISMIPDLYQALRNHDMQKKKVEQLKKDLMTFKFGKFGIDEQKMPRTFIKRNKSDGDIVRNNNNNGNGNGQNGGGGGGYQDYSNADAYNNSYNNYDNGNGYTMNEGYNGQYDMQQQNDYQQQQSAYQQQQSTYQQQKSAYQ